MLFDAFLESFLFKWWIWSPSSVKFMTIVSKYFPVLYLNERIVKRRDDILNIKFRDVKIIEEMPFVYYC